MTQLIPKIWIDHWVTRRGHRFPIPKKDILPTLVAFRKSSVKPTSAFEEWEKLKLNGFDYDELKNEIVLAPKVVRPLAKTARNVESILQGTPFIKSYVQQRVCFYRWTRECAGFQVDYYTITNNEKLSRGLYSKYLSHLTKGQRGLVKSYFGQQPEELFTPSKQLLNDTRKVFPTDNEGLIALAPIPPSIASPGLNYSFRHEAGHAILNQMKREYPDTFYSLAEVYPPLIQRVLPFAHKVHSNMVKEGKNLITCPDEMFYKMYSFIGKRAPEGVFYYNAYNSPEEGFADAFAHFTGTLSEKQWLKKTWPEAYDYLKLILKGA